MSKTMKKLQLKFEFVDTELRAVAMCSRLNAKRKSAKAHYTPWSSPDGKENKFVVWYNE